MASRKRKEKVEEIRKQKRKTVSARTSNQRKYIKAIINNEVIICNGPAGTGKTHVAIGMAFNHLHKGIIERIVIARPVVEAGESLGFLPGDIDDKMSPYIYPIMDELKEYASYTEIAEMKNSGALEICPLAYMRGRTFKDSFIICDECQNATKNQVKMLFTRLGIGSKMVMTGDIDQSDLNKQSQGGFQMACERFDSPRMTDNGIVVVSLEAEDIVRNEKIGIMLDAWED